jgi:succinoglycan biosynthesis transport protein ExoP
MQDPQPALLHYLQILRRQVWSIVLAVAAVLVAVSIYSINKTPVYRASTGIVVGQGGGIFQPEFGTSVEPFTLTMSNLLRSHIVAENVIQNLNLSTTPDALLADLQVTTKPSSSVLEVTYDSTSKARALAVLRSVGTAFATLVDQKLGSQPLQGTGGTGTGGTGTGGTGTGGTGTGAQPQPITARVFDPAHLEPGRVAPRPGRDLLFGAVLGLAIGLALAFVRASFDDRIQSSRDASEAFGAPVIGTLPKPSRRSRAAAGAGDGRQEKRLLSALELLRANVQFSSAVQGPVIVVTSAHEDEGKTRVAGDLGRALASAGNEVICVGADLRRPKLHEYLGRPRRGPGLVDVLEGRLELADALQGVKLDGRRTGVPEQDGRLRLLAAGRVLRVSSSMLAGERLQELVEDLRALGQYVIFDSPPALVAGDVYPLIGAADSVIVVARQGWTTKSTAEAMRTTLEGLGAKRVSVVLTNSERDESGVQEYYQPSGAAPRARKKSASPLSKIGAIRPRPRA